MGGGGGGGGRAHAGHMPLDFAVCIFKLGAHNSKYTNQNSCF